MMETAPKICWYLGRRRKNQGGEYATAHPTKSPHLTMSAAQMRGNASRCGGKHEGIEIMPK